MTYKQPRRKERPGVDRYGRTPLHEAALSGRLAEVTRLAADGADPSAADDNGWTPLHFAAQEFHVDVAEALIAAGASADAKDNHGNTPLWKAVFNSDGRGDLILRLRQHGADPHLPNKHGVTPLTLARRIANYDIAQFFADLP
jgi:uncharacterized protein